MTSHGLAGFALMNNRTRAVNLRPTGISPAVQPRAQFPYIGRPRFSYAIQIKSCKIRLSDSLHPLTFEGSYEDHPPPFAS